MGYRILAPAFFGVLALVGSGLFVHTFTEAEGMYGAAESFMYPRFTLTLWILFALVSFAQSLRRQAPAGRRGAGTLLLAAAAMTFLCLALVPLGFLLTGFIFFVAYALALGYRRLAVVVPSAACTTALLWLLFEKFLDIPLPMGILTA